METLVVDLNRTTPYSLSVAASSFRTDSPFEIVLDNHGPPLHVFLQLDDDLAGAMSLSAGNCFVREEQVRRVGVEVDRSKLPVRGRLKVVTGYGKQTEYVTVTVEDWDDEPPTIDVDETLGEPQPRPEVEAQGFELDLQGAPVLVLGALAVVVALLAALAIGGDLPLLAVLVVLVGAGVAIVLLRS